MNWRFVLVPLCAGLCVFPGFGTLAAPISVDSRPVLFVDRYLIESLQGATLVMHRPEAREVVFQFDAPWEGPESGYITVLQDDGEYRLYYRGGGESTEEVTCMAKSPDGVHWNRLQLGLFEFRGSRSNNIVYRGTTKAYSEAHNFTPFIDLNPAAKAAERYKAVALTKFRDAAGQKQRALAALASADGIHWQKLREEPIIVGSGFDSQNVAFWDACHQQYVCYFREGRNGLRSVRRSVSSDFLNWSKPEWIEFGDAPAEQFYTSAIAPYFRNPSTYLGFPMRFVPERKEIGAEKRKVDALSDGVMISSHDGVNFSREFMEGFIRPGLDELNWGNGHGNNTPSWGVVPTGEGEMSIYWAEHYGADYSGKAGKLRTGPAPQLRRGIMRLDGIASVNAGYKGGELITKLIVLKGRELRLNYSSSAVGSIRVEVQDPQGHALPGFAVEQCQEIYGDELDRVVRWTSTASLSQLENRPIRLRVLLKDADLFSLRMAD